MHKKIIVFDGVCHLCSGWVRFLLARDRAKQYQFAAMQGAAGRQLLVAHGLDINNPVSFLLFDGAKGYTDSDAIIRVLTSLGGLWRMMSIFRLIPAPIRNLFYRWVARHRYSLFGKRDACFAPSSEFTSRFLD